MKPCFLGASVPIAISNATGPDSQGRKGVTSTCQRPGVRNEVMKGRMTWRTPSAPMTARLPVRSQPSHCGPASCSSRVRISRAKAQSAGGRATFRRAVGAGLAIRTWLKSSKCSGGRCRVAGRGLGEGQILDVEFGRRLLGGPGADRQPRLVGVHSRQEVVVVDGRAGEAHGDLGAACDLLHEDFAVDEVPAELHRGDAPHDLAAVPVQRHLALRQPLVVGQPPGRLFYWRVVDVDADRETAGEVRLGPALDEGGRPARPVLGGVQEQKGPAVTPFQDAQPAAQTQPFEGPLPVEVEGDRVRLAGGMFPSRRR